MMFNVDDRVTVTNLQTETKQKRLVNKIGFVQAIGKASDHVDDWDGDPDTNVYMVYMYQLNKSMGFFESELELLIES